MPLYDITCDACGWQEEVFRKVAEYNDLPECCGSIMHRVISAPRIMADIKPYKSMIDGNMITSKSQHREHLHANGCFEVGNETKYLTERKEVHGDFDVRKELTEATRQTLAKL